VRSGRTYEVFVDGKPVGLVGSTIRSLVERRSNGYTKRFGRGVELRLIREVLRHKSEDDESYNFHLKAAEALDIARKKTYREDGGLNKISPLIQAIGHPAILEMERGRMGGRASIQWAKANPEQAFLNSSKAGKLGGRKGGLLGGKRVRELYPNMAEENGHRQGLINAENGHLSLVGDNGRHTRWHVARGKVDPTCVSCVGNISEDLHV